MNEDHPATRTPDLWAVAANARSAQARRDALTAACATWLPTVMTAIEHACDHGRNGCTVNPTEINVASQGTLINALKSLGYEVTNATGIKPTDPFELHIKW